MENHKEIIPKQQEGIATDIKESITLSGSEEAIQFYDIAVNRLKDVNHWHLLTKHTGTKFTLRDKNGFEVKRQVVLGDYFQINIPFPGLDSGKGYDWVQVKELKEENNQQQDEQTFSMLVKPAHPPFEKETAHFFDAEASSTFSVLRNGTKITALVHGRNEKPNTFVHSLAGKIRNIIVALGSFLGFSYFQWKSLVKGLLSDNE
ncbi:hypothetical protein FYC62_08050 [Pedobacter aquae]|uniref:Uncharacterized protein n=1 Tax=Pedobacter aquae TaxID=2605747 RepID=A0A5C0VGG1_9SPHI|nr:hypothetical protein [Pedobacter aquae]QEK51616.1 hypothetical protein FYC62_08050 [Pedobacter aquae]